MAPYGYIYLVRNKVNGKVYIGQTTKSVGQRWTQHRWFARKGKRGPFFGAIRKYGDQSFDVVILHQAFTRDEINAMEIAAISSHDSTNPEVGYNVSTGGAAAGAGPSHFNYGVPKTPEHIARLKEAFKSRPAPTEEHRRKIGEASRGRTHTVSAEARKRISDLQKGKRVGTENHFFGKKHDEHSRLRMSQSARSRPVQNTTGYRGVSHQPDSGRTKPYRASITAGGRRYRIGYYVTAEEAALAYNAKALELLGANAVLNTIPPAER